MNIASRKLLLVAGVVWLVAGLNIAYIGLSSFLGHPRPLAFALVLVALCLVVFTLFHVFVFSKMVRKHTVRIVGIEDEKSPVWKFFDAKGYAIMGVMMGGGIALRAFHLVPEEFVAFFYTGLGCALALGGATFVYRYRRGEKAACPVAGAGNAE